MEQEGKKQWNTGKWELEMETSSFAWAREKTLHI